MTLRIILCILLWVATSVVACCIIGALGRYFYAELTGPDDITPSNQMLQGKMHP